MTSCIQSYSCIKNLKICSDQVNVQSPPPPKDCLATSLGRVLKSRRKRFYATYAAQIKQTLCKSDCNEWSKPLNSGSSAVIEIFEIDCTFSIIRPSRDTKFPDACS